MPQTLIDLDIREGDILTVNAKDYPVKFIEVYRGDLFRGSSFLRMARERATIKRMAPSGADYVETTVAENMPCTYLDPASEGTKQKYREVLNTPIAMLETFIASPNGFYKLVIEDLKK
jgi:hypothetical protein